MSNPLLAISRSAAGRTVHINTIPRPVSVSETREVYRVLSRFGEIDYFRSLRYDKIPSPNGAQVVFKDAAAVQHLLFASPVRFQLGGLENRSEDASTAPASVRPAFGLRSQSSTPVEESPSQQQQQRSSRSAAISPLQDNESPDSDGGPRLFQIIANEAVRDLRRDTDAGPYHGEFDIDRKRLPNSDLRKRVPRIGMSNVDWRVSRRSERLLVTERQRDEQRSLPPLQLLYKQHQAQAAKSGGADQDGSLSQHLEDQGIVAKPALNRYTTRTKVQRDWRPWGGP